MQLLATPLALLGALMPAPTYVVARILMETAVGVLPLTGVGVIDTVYVPAESATKNTTSPLRPVAVSAIAAVDPAGTAVNDQRALVTLTSVSEYFVPAPEYI